MTGGTGAGHTVLVVANVSDPDPGFVGERFTELGWALVTSYREDGVPRTPPSGTDVLLLLGSEWSVAAPHDPAALEAECALVRSSVSTGVPVLGLCYGAQVLAAAYGGRVRRADRPEVGLVAVETTDPELVPGGPWSAFHTDVIDPPETAEVVARNGCGVQAFRMPGALGVQFHPEVRAEVLDGWSSRLPAMLHAAGVDRVALHDEARRQEQRSRSAAGSLVDAFLARVAGVAAS